MKTLLSIVSASLILPCLLSCSDASSYSFTVNTSLTASASRALKARAARDCARDPVACSGSPESLIFKIYEVYLSENTDCSDPVLVSDFGTAGADIELGVEPLIQASPTSGTYNCLIFKMSDNLRFTPDAEAVADHPLCVADTESIFDIFRTDSGREVWKAMDGSSVTATGTSAEPGDDTVYIFGSTDIDALLASDIAPSANQTLELMGALTVPGSTTFYADFTDGVAESDGVCKIEGGTGMGFRE